MQVHSHQAKHNRVLPPLHSAAERPKEQWEPEFAGSHYGSALRVRHGEGFNVSEGELYRKIIKKRHVTYLANRSVKETLDEAKKDFPKEAEFAYETTVDARDEEYQVWFKRWFGSGEDTK